MTDDSTLEIHGDAEFFDGDWPDRIVAIRDDRDEDRVYRLEPQGEDGHE